MARYKHYDMNQTKLIPASYADQVMEGSFEYALNEFVQNHLDLSVFETPRKPPERGAGRFSRMRTNQ
ncbi:MAG: hypothetical protein QM784_09370 [Polyangiaceae bacterium]